jgi:hypothetical protein
MKAAKKPESEKPRKKVLLKFSNTVLYGNNKLNHSKNCAVTQKQRVRTTGIADI